MNGCRFCQCSWRIVRDACMPIEKNASGSADRYEIDPGVVGV